MCQRRFETKQVLGEKMIEKGANKVSNARRNANTTMKFSIYQLAGSYFPVLLFGLFQNHIHERTLLLDGFGIKRK